jgi:prevent-host-death family protein
MMQEISVRQFKLNCCRLLEAVEKKGWALTVTFHGRGRAVILPVQRYLQLAEAEERQDAPQELGEPILPSQLLGDEKTPEPPESAALDEDTEVEEFEEEPWDRPLPTSLFGGIRR